MRAERGTGTVGRVGRRPPLRAFTLSLPAALALMMGSGCELTETLEVEPPEMVVAEVLLRAGELTQKAYLHRTGTPDPSTGRQVPGARIVVRDAVGDSIVLVPSPLSECVVFWRGSFLLADGSCYSAFSEPDGPPRPEDSFVQPGRRYDLRIETHDGRVLEGSTTVPGAFELRRPDPEEGEVCWIPPERSLEVVWTQAEGAWAYIVEAYVNELRGVLEPRGIEVPEDPLFLRGVSVSQADTTVSFPGAFGLLDRLELDRELLLALQDGLPDGVWADVLIAAADPNFVNWGRGGTFNPSGTVRIPSIRGDGTGVFGSMNPLTFRTAADGAVTAGVDCRVGVPVGSAPGRGEES